MCRTLSQAKGSVHRRNGFKMEQTHCESKFQKNEVEANIPEPTYSELK